MKLPLGRCAGSRAKDSYLRSESPLSGCINKLPDTQRSSRQIGPSSTSPCPASFGINYAGLRLILSQRKISRWWSHRDASPHRAMIQSSTKYDALFHFSGCALNGTVLRMRSVRDQYSRLRSDVCGRDLANCEHAYCAGVRCESV